MGGSWQPRRVGVGHTEGVRRAARFLVVLGPLVVVLSAGQYHGQRIGHYDFLADGRRFVWSLVYAAVLAVAAYAVGLPDLASKGRTALLSSVGACLIGAGVISTVQLAGGAPLLPRFVVGVSAIVLVPWFAATTRVAVGGRKQERWKDRVIAVLGPEDAASLAEELGHDPEHDARLVEVLTLAEARPGVGAGEEPLVDRAISSGATVLILDKEIGRASCRERV